jgi:purine nucleosidase
VVDWDNRLKLPARANVVLELDQARFGALVRKALGA